MKTMTAIAALAAAVIASPVAAQRYDAFNSFNGTQGAGNFFYSEVASDFSSFSLFTTSNTNCFIDNAQCLQQAPNHDVPGFTKGGSPAFQYGTVNVPQDRLIAHPDDDSDLTVGAFVAPTAGTYRFFASFNTQDVSPTGVSLFQIGTDIGGVIGGTQIGALSAANRTFSFSSGPIQLAQGQAYGFGVGNAGFYGNDSTGFNFVGGVVPEPATWALMIMGFGAIGGAMRRRTRTSVAYA